MVVSLVMLTVDLMVAWTEFLLAETSVRKMAGLKVEKKDMQKVEWLADKTVVM